MSRFGIVTVQSHGIEAHFATGLPAGIPTDTLSMNSRLRARLNTREKREMSTSSRVAARTMTEGFQAFKRPKLELPSIGQSSILFSSLGIDRRRQPVMCRPCERARTTLLLPQNSFQSLSTFEPKGRIVSRTQHARGTVIHNAHSGMAQCLFADQAMFGLIGAHPACDGG